MARVFEIVFLAFVASQSIVTAECPEIIPRGHWGARQARFIPVLPIRPAPFVILHPMQKPICNHPTACGEILRPVQDFHMDANGWPDISYHFMHGAGTAGYKVYEGRGWGRAGVNVGAFSNQAINIGFIGGFSTQSPSVNATNHVNSIIECGISQGHLAQNVRVLAQCQVTDMVRCSDTTVFEWVSRLERFESNPRPV